MKICAKCKVDLPLESFSRHSREKDGLNCYCRECKSEMDKAYQENNKEKIKVRRHKYYKENEKEIKDKTFAYKKINPDKARVYSKTSNKVIKAEAMKYYCQGDIKCQGCGDDEFELLTIDHIDGNGNKHRQETGAKTGKNFCFWLKRNNYPSGFQVLCWNCQWLKRYQEMKPKGEITKRQQQKMDYVKSVKQEILAHYGKQCPCGIDNPILLTLDHTNDDGAEHRKTAGSGFNFYIWLRKNNFPNDPPLQVLCMKCQYRKRNLLLPNTNYDIVNAANIQEGR
jgi:hypothetical protein